MLKTEAVVVSMIAFFPNDLSLNCAEVYNFSVKLYLKIFITTEAIRK